MLGCGGSREPWAPAKRALDETDAKLANCSGLGADIVTEYGFDFEAGSGLRESGVAIGAAVSPNYLSEKGYAETLAREFSLLTAENEMKWYTTESIPGVFDFSAADTLVRFAEQNKMHVRGHTLVWHSQLPDWASKLVGVDTVRSAMRRHIEGLMSHYRDEFPGRVAAWDVVNEALDGNADGEVFYRDSPFYRELGEGFIEEAFRLARDVDPSVKLYYNDFGIEGMGAKATATFEMLRDLLQRGVPIDGVGFQMHTRAEDRGPILAEFRANLARYAQLGLPVNISEMDAKICDTPGTLPERLDQQRIRFNRIGAECLRSGICDSVTVWGIHDGASWLNNRPTPCGDGTTGTRPLLFDDQFKRKPAWVGLSDALLGCYY